MTGWFLVAGQALLLALFAPFLLGLTRAVRARVEGRGGGRMGRSSTWGAATVW